MQRAMTVRAGRRLIAGGLVVLAGWLASGCATTASLVPTNMLEADKYLYDRGSELLGRRKFVQSREFFRQVVDNYPQSAFRPESKLAMGDTYFGEGSPEAMVLAQNEYKEFLTFFPTHPRADYAQFKMGMTHLKQMLSADRDQTEAKATLVELAAFLQRYPNSALLAESKMQLREARNRLSDADFKVGFFYWRNKWWPGAIERFRAVVNDDPEYPSRDAVFFHLADCYVKVGNKAQALPYYERLIAEFKKSKYLAESEKAAAGIKAQIAELMKKQ